MENGGSEGQDDGRLVLGDLVSDLVAMKRSSWGTYSYEWDF